MIAARKRAGDLLRAGDLDLNLVNVSGEGLSLFTLPNEASRGEVTEIRQTEVFADRLAEDKSLCLAIFGQQANALPNGIPRVVDGERLAVESNAAAVGSVGAEKQSRRLGATGSDEPCQAKHLASPNLERHILHAFAAVEVFDNQAWLVGRGVAFRKLLVETAADHWLDHLLAGEIIDGAGVDVLTIPQEGDAVGILKSVKPVAYVNDPDILRFQFVDHTKQSLGFARERAALGSSMTMIRASCERVLAISTICCWATVRLLHSASTGTSTPMRSNNACARASSLARGMKLMLPGSCPRKIFSRADRCGMRLNS